MKASPALLLLLCATSTTAAHAQSAAADTTSTPAADTAQTSQATPAATPAPATTTAQADQSAQAPSTRKPWLSVSGSLQSQLLLNTADALDGAASTSKVLHHHYLDLRLDSKHLSLGGRYEYMRQPLPGYEAAIAGQGLPYFYAQGRWGMAELTLGGFYEQFGSGIVLHTYEDRTLGTDNQLSGARLVLRPIAGLQIKALTGRQRNYWTRNAANISAADIEAALSDWLPALSRRQMLLSIGASVVNKHEQQELIMANPTQRLRLPEEVTAFDLRANWQYQGLNLLAEYAYKSQDPSLQNDYIYRSGHAALLSASYSREGLSLLLQAKRCADMDFRSRRSQVGIASQLGHMPPFTPEHSYTLASRNLYGTQATGEWAYQASVGYFIDRGTALGGKYGTDVRLNFSHVRGIEHSPRGGRGSKGYGSAFWAQGQETYYQDANLQIEKKLSRRARLNLMYLYQRYNATIVEGSGGMVRAHIGVAEGNFRLGRHWALRCEAQYLSTKDDLGDWSYGLVEIAWRSRWMLTLSHLYNHGETHRHYGQAQLSYTAGSHRLQVGYVNRPEGYDCSGGVCRFSPEQQGILANYTYNF